MMADRARIVVGVDGSVSSRRALAWAANEAELRDWDLEVIYAWSLEGVAWASPLTAMLLRDRDLDERGQAILDEALRELGETGASITATIVHDTPADALLWAAESAQMLVLGGRGSDPLNGFRLRTTHARCLRDAKCPVVLIPEDCR